MDCYSKQTTNPFSHLFLAFKTGTQPQTENASLPSELALQSLAPRRGEPFSSPCGAQSLGTPSSSVVGGNGFPGRRPQSPAAQGAAETPVRQTGTQPPVASMSGLYSWDVKCGVCVAFKRQDRHTSHRAAGFPGAGMFPRESKEGLERRAKGRTARASTSPASRTPGSLCLRVGTSGAARGSFSTRLLPGRAINPS